MRQALGGLDAGQPPTSPAGGESQQTVLASAASGTVAKLTAEADRQAAALEEITHYFEAQRRELARSPAAWPARGLVTSDFGARLDPYTADRVLHRGLDIAGPAGGPVLAPSDGTVTFAGSKTGYGKRVVIDHGLGIETTYSHLARIEVKRGQAVQRGQRLGTVGSTGRATGPHLHYEVRVDGEAVNPRQFIMD